MVHPWRWLGGCIAAAGLLVCGPSGGDAAELARSRPNFLLILADDMGFSDAGCYGGETRTPNLDRLAANGLRFTQFYNTARCWPSRAAILTGYYAQQVRRDTVPGVPSGGGGVRPTWARLLPAMLRPLGYRSYHSGKWHLDGPALAGGFDRSYRLEDHNRHFAPREQYVDDQKQPPVQAGESYYTSTAIASYAIAQLEQHQIHHPDRPFFQYLCFTAPHFPLQAPANAIARCRDRYRPGWEWIRQQRYRHVRAMGIAGNPLPPVEREVGPPYRFPEAFQALGSSEVDRPWPWEELTAAQQEFQAAKMAIHAAMIECMDSEIGRVLDQVRAMGAWENTLVLFLSDNGASAEIMVRGDGHDPGAAMGSPGSFLCLGPGWSSVANCPLRRHKTWAHEGGIATPLILHWPKGIAARGQLRHTPGHLVDLVPTMLELAGASRPVGRQGEEAPAPPGHSLLPAFTRDAIIERDSLWWMHEGNRALRVGDWKLVAAGTNAAWELYNLRKDRGETHDLAQKQASRTSRLARMWSNQWDQIRAVALRDVPPADLPAASSGSTEKAPASPSPRGKP